MSDANLGAAAAHDDIDGVTGPLSTLRLFGHHPAWEELLAARAGERFHHAWLLQGPVGIGKATTAYAFARTLLGARPERRDGATVAFLADDPVVRQIAQGTHPGLIHIVRPGNERTGGFRTQITVDEVRRLNRFFHATASGSGWRVALIDPADDMNRSAANALLKILEEPPPRSTFLITSHAPGRLLPTIRSRCRLLRFDPLEPPDLALAIEASRPGTDAAAIKAATPLAEGSVRQALMLIGSGGIEINATLATLLKADRPDWNAIHAMADALTLKGREAAYDLLLAALLASIAQASEARLDAGDGEGAALLAALWQAECSRLREAAAYNLDRKQTLLTLFDGFYAERAASDAA
ncbi:MAG: DNA polymerase III subunit delta' [Aurantimonas endophytica]|uniref:DNA polymerase-3 subunit delta n=1 Tax=Aurantimonas endophytica TaxID=1522175 RepID=A0A7W6HB25_9HYPH|nr:DNA polymerase III subunit delta' [Aurantimonas endophytica]MBB4001633.1 DNA polymerase-3 subunit delta' [Aurantimonas endophytica]MCO6402730.1 DNA polymerase III subunit delta' [Aurantimonas endophytica]